MNFPRPRHPQIGPDPGGIPEEPRSRPPRYVPPGPGPPRAGSRRIPGPPGSAQAAELLPPRFTTGSSAPFLSLLPIGQQGGISYCTPTLIGPARRPSKGCSPPPPVPAGGWWRSGLQPASLPSPRRQFAQRAVSHSVSSLPPQSPHALRGALVGCISGARRLLLPPFPLRFPRPQLLPRAPPPPPRSLALPSLPVVCGARQR